MIPDTAPTADARPHENDRRDRDDAQVLIAGEGAEDVHGAERERTREGPRYVAEQETGSAVDERGEPERDDHQRQDGRAFDRADDNPLNQDTCHEGDREREREGEEVVHAMRDQGVSDERREHRHLTLGEVDQAHRVVDKDEGQREAAEDAAAGDAAHDLLDEFLH
jgi:hypothetical protein